MKQKDSISSTGVVVFSIKPPPATLFMIVSSIDAQPTNNSELNRHPTHKQQSQHQKTVNADLILSMTQGWLQLGRSGVTPLAKYDPPQEL